MTKLEQVKKEADILNRLAYVLDEYSVHYIAAHDRSFREYITELQESIIQKQCSLLV